MTKNGKNGCALNTALYGLYLLFVLGTAVYTNFCELETHRLLGRFWLLLAGVSFGAPLVMKWVRGIELRPGRPNAGMNDWVFRAICFISSLAVLMFCFLGVNPGGLDGDPVMQLQQAMTGQYNDFHPVLHTLLFFSLPLAMTGGWFSAIVPFQILLFSLALTFVCDTVRRYAGSLWGCLTLALIICNAFTQSMLMFPFKDEAFGICAMALACCSARILFSEGNWLKKPLRLILFGALLAVTSIVRHNGVLFAFFILLGALTVLPRKRALAVIGVAAAVFIGVKGPLYAALKVEYPETRSAQILGLPMSTLGGAVKYRPEKLDEETLVFAYEVAPKELWEEEYSWGNFTWVEWDSPTAYDKMTEAGAAGSLRVMLRAFRQAPKECLKALIRTTDIVYNVVPDYLAEGGVYLGGRNLGVTYQGVPWIKRIMDQYRLLTGKLFPHGMLHSGVTLLLLLTVMLAKWPLNRKESWKRILPALSVFAYNFGTMFMLTSWQDGARFFHYSWWVGPVFLVMLLREEKKDAAVY